MHQLSKSSLPFISGGLSSWQLPGSAATGTSSAKPVAKASLLVHPAASNTFDGLLGEASSTCNCSQNTWNTPQNGDRNALGQRCSWGTWWDDMH